MSKIDRKQKKTYGITIDVSEKIVEEVISKGKKPNLIFSKLIDRITSEIDLNEILNYVEGNKYNLERNKKLIKNSNKSIKYPIFYNKWNYGSLDNYMKNLVNQAEKRASSSDLISMLIAYFETSSRPTSEELRDARGFGGGEKWYEELRTSKSRLTILAKHLGLPSFFIRAYGSGLNRRHPLDPEVYKYLQQWFSNNKDIILKYKKSATPRSAD